MPLPGQAVLTDALSAQCLSGRSDSERTQTQSEEARRGAGEAAVTVALEQF